MKILDVFKKKKGEEGIKKEARKEVKDEAKEAKPAEKTRVKKEAKTGQSYRVLKIPHITEKATDLAEKNQYSFRIFPGANKIEVKRAVEEDFGVNVVSVKIVNLHKKKRRLGKIQGTRPGYKKAIVKIKKGQKIELLPR